MRQSEGCLIISKPPLYLDLVKRNFLCPLLKTAYFKEKVYFFFIKHKTCFFSARVVYLFYFVCYLYSHIFSLIILFLRLVSFSHFPTYSTMKCCQQSQETTALIGAITLDELFSARWNSYYPQPSAAGCFHFLVVIACSNLWGKEVKGAGGKKQLGAPATIPESVTEWTYWYFFLFFWLIIQGFSILYDQLHNLPQENL